MTNGKPWPRARIGNKNYTEAAVVIIGSGIAGMCAAIDLLKINKCRNFIILEKSSGPGGTWRDNKYPGCCCDVWSHLYSYSFEQNPDWTREYAPQEEILDYLQDVAHKYQLYRYARFNSSVDKAEWDDVAKRWNISVTVLGGKEAEFGGSYTIQCDYLVSGVGQLNVPHLPNIAGLQNFEGKVMHSARWDWSYNLACKKVAIIGAGSTAVQIIPEVVKTAASLTVYQRTPSWIVPRLDSPIPIWKRCLYRYVPYTRRLKRSRMMDLRESSFSIVVKPTSGFGERFEGLSKAHMREQLPNRKDLWEKLQPTYTLGCKRVVVSDNYFPVFLRDNVKLETTKIDKVSAKGIVVDGHEEAYDLIILATGFRTVEFMCPIEINGSAGRPLASVWKNGPEALNGVCVESLPNFGMLYGPNTNLSHNSIVLMIEAQSRYINALIREVLRAKTAGGQLVMQPNAQKVAEQNRTIQSELEETNYADPNCDSWYKLASSGKITNNWSGTALEYQKLLSKVEWSDFDISGTSIDHLRGNGLVTERGRVVEESSVSYSTIKLAAFTAVAGVACKILFRIFSC